MNQFIDTYPDVKRYVGAAHYKERKDYLRARDYAADPSNHICTNPMALHFLKNSHPGYTDSDVVILDEADQIMGLLNNLALHKVKIPKNVFYNQNLRMTNNLIEWLQDQADTEHANFDMEVIQGGRTTTKMARAENRWGRFQLLADLLRYEPEKIGVKWTDEDKGHYLTLQPTRLPVSLMRQLFGKAKVIMLSATLFDVDLFEGFPADRIKRFETSSPIPPKVRPFKWTPLGVEKWYPSPIEAMADKCVSLMNKHPDLRPVLIHTTYADGPLLTTALKARGVEAANYSDKEAKNDCLKKWMEEGGVLVGAGVTTGLDLKDDLCRLNIITKMLFPCLGEDVVVKRKLADMRWYEIATIRHVIQSYGRSSRHETDKSMTYCLDDRFGRLRWKLDNELPAFFKEGIVL